MLALDREPRFVELARRRVGDRAEVRVADLERPLDLPDASRDVVVASLVLHYLRDWGPLLAELHRVLVPGGSLVFSVHHPITGWSLSDRADYHRTEIVRESWSWDGVPVTAEMYRRPVSEVFRPLREAGFGIDVVDEPLPVAGTEGDPRVLDVLASQPVFLFVRAVRTAG